MHWNPSLKITGLGLAMMMVAAQAGAAQATPAPIEVQVPAVSQGALQAVPDVAIEQYVSEYKVGHEKARRNLALQTDLRAVEVQASAAAGRRLVGTWLHHGDTPRLEMRLSRGARDEALERRLRGLSPLATVTYGVQEEQDELAARASAALQEMGGLSSHVLTLAVEGASGALRVEVSADVSVVEVQEAFATALQAGTYEEIHVVPVAGGAGDTNSGGLATTSCTTGFSVRNSSGTSGLLTAGHCNNTQSYSLYGFPGTYAMTYRAEVRSANADLQWHTISGTVYPRFYGNSTSTPTTLTASTPRSSQGGRAVCRRGKASGYDCGTVTSTSAQPTWTDACPGTTCASTWISVNIGTIGGDSGGPWWSGGSAYGIQKGGSSSSTIYMPVDYIGTLGVAVFYG